MDLFTATISVLIGGGLFSLIQFLIQRHDKKHDKFQGVESSIGNLSKKMDDRFDVLDEKIDKVDSKADQNNAVAMRVRILRFRDEMLMEQKHTHDSYQQVLSDIDGYEKYCAANPAFKNNQTVETIKHIKASYQKRLEKHDFLV